MSNYSMVSAILSYSYHTFYPNMITSRTSIQSAMKTRYQEVGVEKTENEFYE